MSSFGQYSSNLEKTARYIVYATPLVLILFLSDFYFPFIVPRTVLFRVLVSISLFIGAMLWARGEIRIRIASLKKRLLFCALALFLIINVIASFFGYSFINSFFGDIERSWGLYTLIHVFLFYALTQTVLIERTHWILFLRYVSAGTGMVALYGILQRAGPSFGVEVFDAGVGRITSTLGNPAYAAITILFGIGILSFLLLCEPSKKIRFLHAGALAVHLIAFSMTGIRGAYLGAIAGIFVSMAWFTALSRRKALKRTGMAMLGIIILCGALIFIFRGNAALRNIPVAGRLGSISLSDSTAVTRLIGWRAALNGFKDNPFFGVGLENFSVVFNTYFDPVYYTYASSEPYFDRAHNSFLDVLATSGMLGFLAYMLIFAVCAYYLVCLFKQRRAAYGVLAGLVAAYMVHIFFVFDDLSALYLFFAVVGYIEYARHRGALAERSTRRRMPLGAFASVVLLGALIGYNIFFNATILRTSKTVVKGVAYAAERSPQAGELYEQALSANTTIPRKTVLEPYVNYLIAIGNEYALTNDRALKDTFNENIEIVLAAYKKEISTMRYDPILFTKIANAHLANFLVNARDRDKKLTIAYLQEAVVLSPNRPQYYNLLSEAYALFDEPERAIESAERSFALNQDYKETYVYLVRSHLLAEDLDAALRYYPTFIANFGKQEVGEPLVLGQKLIAAGRLDEAKEVFELWLNENPKSADALVHLTIIALKQQREDEAITYAQRAAEADRTLQEEVDYIIQEVMAGRSTELLEQIGG